MGKRVLLVDRDGGAGESRANYWRRLGYDVQVTRETVSLFPGQDTFDCMFFAIRPYDDRRSFQYERAHQPNAHIIVYAKKKWLEKNKAEIKAVGAVPMEMPQSRKELAFAQKELASALGRYL